jgi:hypothetical protein
VMLEDKARTQQRGVWCVLPSHTNTAFHSFLSRALDHLGLVRCSALLFGGMQSGPPWQSHA